MSGALGRPGRGCQGSGRPLGASVGGLGLQRPVYYLSHLVVLVDATPAWMQRLLVYLLLDRRSDPARCQLRRRALSVVVGKQPGRDRPLALAPDVVGDHPDRAVVGGGVAGEEAAVACAGCFLVGSLVVAIEVAPIAGGMAIEQGGDERVGNVGGHGGGGHHSAEVMEHGAGG